MKTFKYLLISIAACILAVSCSLQEESYTEMEKSEYMNSSKEAENVLLGVYRNLTREGLYRYHLSLLFTLPSDMAKCEGSTTNSYRIIPANAFTAGQTEVQETWGSLYHAIYEANDFIEHLAAKMQGYTDNEKSVAAVYMAEARSLRALFYFELVRWFGNVPLITSTAQSELQPTEFKQADPEEVYAFIEEDLLYAVKTLPYADNDQYRADNSFRFSKGAAMGLLTKVYATWAGYPLLDAGKWEKAATIAKELIESGHHHLLPDFEQLWKNTCNGIWNPDESLIEVSFYAPVASGGSDPVGRIGKWNGVKAEGIPSIRNSSNWKPIPTFMRDWKDRELDKRWAISAVDYQYKAGKKVPISSKGNFEDAMAPSAPDDLMKVYINGMSPGKWDTELYVEDANELIEKDQSNINWYILRYSDVLLLYAEALNEWKQGPTKEAYEAVNMVRRRGLGKAIGTASVSADLPENLSYEEFRQAIRDERGYELAFEGHRRQDLIRWGIYYESIRKTAQDLEDWYTSTNYACVNFTRKNKHELFPIPLTELDLCPQFKQNPGW